MDERLLEWYEGLWSSRSSQCITLACFSQDFQKENSGICGYDLQLHLYNTYFNAKKGTYYVLTLKRPVIQNPQACTLFPLWFQRPFTRCSGFGKGKISYVHPGLLDAKTFCTTHILTQRRGHIMYSL